MVKLYSYQLDAIDRMSNGCVLCGGVGSGKSLTSLGYYYICNGGSKDFLDAGEYIFMKDPADLYIITTARKRDTKEWELEMVPFLMELYSNRVTVDSWNNIKKYNSVTDAFFIFDEQRVVGSGEWVKSFLKIAKQNRWILLSATPGDTWMDYIPIFLANGFYKNRTEFNREHVIFSRFSKYPKVERYINTGRLIRLRDRILVNMEFDRQTKAEHYDISVGYDKAKYREVGRERWNPYTDEPIINAAELCYIWRRIVNEAEERQTVVLELMEKHPKAIIFYSFDYEWEILHQIFDSSGYDVAEWNGHKHNPIPTGEKWVYLVQYTAGAEGWNCITTDTIIFYSQHYSYKIMQQASGRIDRLNTPYRKLYYYHLKSSAPIDLAIARALKEKKKFNETKFVTWERR